MVHRVVTRVHRSHSVAHWVREQGQNRDSMSERMAVQSCKKLVQCTAAGCITYATRQGSLRTRCTCRFSQRVGYRNLVVHAATYLHRCHSAPRNIATADRCLLHRPEASRSCGIEQSGAFSNQLLFSWNVEKKTCLLRSWHGQGSGVSKHPSCAVKRGFGVASIDLCFRYGCRVSGPLFAASRLELDHAPPYRLVGNKAVTEKHHWSWDVALLPIAFG